MRKLGWFAVALFAVAGCSNGTHASMDGGVGDLALPDLLPGPSVLNGNNVVPVKGLSLTGVTADDFVVYVDGMALKTVALAGGTPQSVDPAVGLARVRGKAVLSWGNIDMGTGIGALTLWTSTGGAVALSAASIARAANVSKDGLYVIYSDNVDASGVTGEIRVAKTDGTGKHKVVGGKSADSSCTPVFASAGGKFIATYCNDAGDAGVSPATISQVDPTTGVATELLSNSALDFFSVDSAGTKVFAIDQNNSAMVKTIGSAGAAVIDSAVTDGFITKDGTAVVYTTMAGALKRVTLASPTPVTLVGSNATGFAATSNNEQFVVFNNQFDSSLGLYDMFLASTTTPGAPLTLLDTPTGSVYGDAFTTDDKYAVFYTDVDMQDFAGTLMAAPTAGGAPRQFATRVWLSYAVSGSKFVYNDAYVSTTAGGTATLKSIDLGNAADTGTVIANKADQDFFFSNDRTKVVFTHNAVKGKEGLYVAPIQ